MNKKETKRLEKEAFESKVRVALTSAHEAAQSAAQEFVANANLTSDGFVSDISGSAIVIVLYPSYRLRQALKAMDEIQWWYQGGWSISNFYSAVPPAGIHSISAHRCACEAASKVLKKDLSGEGKLFFSRGYTT